MVRLFRLNPIGAFFVLAALAAPAACNQVEDLREAIERPRTPHEEYSDGLREAGLEGTALGSRWFEAANRALSEAQNIALPYREAVYVSAAEPRAFGYRVVLQQGQMLSVLVERDAREPVRVFLDAFEPPRDTTEGPRRRASADSEGLTLTVEAERDDTLLVRIQPELLRDVRLTITLEARGALAFPVSGKDTRAVQSFFGAPRDAGARQHHGIDIFAPRGTPAIAAAAGRVSVRNNRLGGKTVWLRDPERGISLYYAHLDSQIVSSGDFVQVGDTVGLIGNTGNARNTPPHLHFGIYRRGQGPRDPYAYVHQPRRGPEPIGRDTSYVGVLARVRASAATMRTMPDADAAQRTRLTSREVVRVVGVSAGWARAEAPDGTTGWIRLTQLARAEAPLSHERLADAVVLRDAPDTAALEVALLPAGERVEVLGRAGDARLVRANGVLGWMMSDANGRSEANE
jgi:murein DD-endopeptidase MepM/ murein hydrolase activator NlpD/SH3-like domain-containing protein